MRAIVVGGAGAMGRVAVRDLARSPDVEWVTVADLEAHRAEAVAAEAGGTAQVRGIAADATSATFPELLRGHDVCIASVAYRLNPRIAQACMEAGCGYVDLGGLFHVAREVLSNDARFREAGLTGVTCMGGSPGITNLLAVMGARELDDVYAIHIRLGADDPFVQDSPLPIPYSLDTILDEFTIPAMAWRDGRFQEVAPLGEPEEVDFPPPVGRKTAFTTLHSEIATLPTAFPGAREITFKIAFDPAFVERFQLVAGLGLASTEPIELGGEWVRPRDVLSALGRRLPQAAGSSDTECLRVVLEGVREGRPARTIADSVVEPDPLARMGGGALDTGIPPSIVAQMIAGGEIEGPGLFAPEDAVNPDLFFKHLADRGIHYTIRTEP
ncbi:MAG TPA: saccharopine dehydrogenase C-terminal domain-containing protein [Actinomycetota bacterium]|jgi:saccharopine dehydrogenase (NAD+, L-lysine-forming)